jgi:dUTP pyrophosphatase
MEYIVGIKLEDGIELPKYETDGSSGMDLKAWKYSFSNSLNVVHDFPEDGKIIYPHERLLIKTGISVELPANTEIQLRPRSGLSLKHGIVAQFGTVDSDYTGDVSIILLNTSNEPFIINKGDRLGQIVLASVDKIKWQKVNELGETERGTGGFGSTGS